MDTILLILKVLIPIVGLFIGSFANVLIYRIPKGEEWVKTPSHCTACGKPLKWYMLFPVLSWAFQGGKCAYCRTKISAQYPLIELANAALWLLCVSVFGISPFLAVALALSTSLLVLSVIDWRIQEIPDGINLFLLVVGILWNVYGLIVGLDIWLENLIGFFCVSGLFYILALLTKGGMGGGDIKLMAVCGLIIGWQRVLLSVAIAALAGTVIMLPMYLSKKRKREEMVPFGPFLAFGVFAAMLWGYQLIDFYIAAFIR